MPKIAIVNGYRISFYSFDCQEPIHVHVTKSGMEAKFWMEPEIQIVFNRGFKRHQLSDIEGILRDIETLIRQKWEAHCK